MTPNPSADPTDETRRLLRAVDELTVLNRIAQAVGATSTYQEVIDELVKHTIRCLKAEQVVISLVEKNADTDPRTIVRHRASGGLPEFHLTQGLQGLILVSNAPFLSNDPQHDQALRGILLPESLDSLLCVPLTVKGAIIGVLIACNKKSGNGFGPDDQRLLAIIASQSAQVLENARLREEEIQLEKMQRDVRLAREIQLGLLPDAAPEVPGYEFAADSLPAQSVGGDYYDFVPLSGQRMGLCLGDVSGKGVPASLLMSNLQATIRGQAHANPDAGSCLNWANQLLFRSTPVEKFATLFYAILDPENHQLNFSNAGHEHPLLLRADATGQEPEKLATGGLMLGILPDFSYLQNTIDLRPGDLLFIFSDGVTDAENPAGEPFGEGALLRLLRTHRSKPAIELVRHVGQAVAEHAATADQLDDITMVALKRLDEPRD